MGRNVSSSPRPSRVKDSAAILLKATILCRRMTHAPIERAIGDYGDARERSSGLIEVQVRGERFGAVGGAGNLTWGSHFAASII